MPPSLLLIFPASFCTLASAAAVTTALPYGDTPSFALLLSSLPFSFLEVSFVVSPCPVSVLFRFLLLGGDRASMVGIGNW